MRRAERVVLALGALGEAGEAAALAQGADAVAPAGEDLVRIGLVADVPDQPVARGVEDPVQGDGELDDAEPGAQVAAGHRHGVDRLLPQLVDQLAQVLLGNGAQVRGRLDPIEQRRLGGLVHVHSPRPYPAYPDRLDAATISQRPAQFGRRSVAVLCSPISRSASRERWASETSLLRLERLGAGGSPAWLKVSFSTLASACFRRRSQCSFRASPRS